MHSFDLLQSILDHVGAEWGRASPLGRPGPG
jgi:hypothetical protein